MEITENVALSNYSTMRLGGVARYLVEVRNRNELKEAHHWAMRKELPILMIGTGSNIVWRDEGFAGLILVNRITGYDDYNEDALSHYITVGAGEQWDSVVARSVASGLTGIEALSLIPGTAGATPVQNVGAYGQELSQTLTSIEAFDASTGQLVNIPAEACGFAYRTSKFQTEYRDRFFITAITLHLMAGNPYPPFYSAIDQYFQQHPPAGTVTPRVIRDAVIAIRQAKLPDPGLVANTGSFFANPIVDEGTLTDLRTDNPAMPYWPVEGGGAKIPAAWLIEQVGFKDVHDAETGMATWAAQPLVLVNESATSTAQLLTFRNKVITAVQARYNITLKQEPELLPKA